MHVENGVHVAGGSREAYAFGPFVLDLRERALYRDGLTIELPAKIFEILQCLVLGGGRVVSKDTLVEHVWQAAPVGDNNIAQHVHLTRSLLDDAQKPHKYIATVHGRGYRLLIEPSKVQLSQPQPIATELRTSQILAEELVSNAAFFATMGTEAALASAMHLCREALDVCASYAEAHAQIAQTAILTSAFGYAEPVDQFEIAKRHAAHALKLDPHSARAHIAMALLSVLLDLEPDRAFAHLDAAAGERPDMPEIAIVRAVALTAAKRHAQARRVALDGLAMHPGSSAVAAYAAFCAYHDADLEWTVHAVKRLLIFKPSVAFATFLLGCAYLAQGNYSPARETLMSIISGRASAMAGYEKFRQRAIAALSFIEARTGSVEDARALARDVQRSEHCSYLALAIARAGAGEDEAVIACIQEARRRRDPWFPFASSDPLLREYHDVPEFQSALAGEARSSFDLF